MTKIDIHTVDGRIWHGDTDDFDTYLQTVIEQYWIQVQEHIWIQTSNIIAVIDRNEPEA